MERAEEGPLTVVAAVLRCTTAQVFIVDTRANKRQIKDAVLRLYDIQTKKVNTLIRYPPCRTFRPTVMCNVWGLREEERKSWVVQLAVQLRPRVQLSKYPGRTFGDFGEMEP